MGCFVGSPSGPSTSGDERENDQTSLEGIESDEIPLGDSISGLLADAEIGSVSAVREIREDG